MPPTLTDLLIAAGDPGSRLDFSLLPPIGTPFLELGLVLAPGITFNQLDVQAKGALFFCHPHAIPDDLPVVGVRLWSPPGTWSPTSKWKLWLKCLEQFNRSRPDDPQIPLLLAAAKAALNWRESVPQELRFWADGNEEAEQW